MKRALLEVPITVTAVRFDVRGRAVPSRIDWQGQSIHISSRLQQGLLPFRHNGKYFWLRQARHGWQVVSQF